MQSKYCSSVPAREHGVGSLAEKLLLPATAVAAAAAAVGCCYCRLARLLAAAATAAAQRRQLVGTTWCVCDKVVR